MFRDCGRGTQILRPRVRGGAKRGGPLEVFLVAEPETGRKVSAGTHGAGGLMGCTELEPRTEIFYLSVTTVRPHAGEAGPWGA